MGNTIAFNGGEAISASRDVVVLRNSIFGNQGRESGGGIFYRKGFPTAEYKTLFPPRLDRVTAGSTVIKGRFKAEPDLMFRVEFFQTPRTECQGRRFLGAQTGTTNASGKLYFSFENDLITLTPGVDAVTATATYTGGLNFIVTSSFSNCRVVESDKDGDGIPDETEEKVADGDRDGTADSEQGNVASLVGETTNVTIQSNDGSLKDVSAVPRPNPSTRPADVLPATRPVGFFRESGLGGLQIQGASPQVTIFFDEDFRLDSYYNYGPTPDNPEDHWYEFLLDGTTGAEILEDRVVLHFQDGARGDHDLEENGVIVTLGGPVLLGKSLYFPFYQADAANFAGFAVSNFSQDDALMEFVAFDSDGGVSLYEEDPAYFELESDNQLAQLGREIFQVEADERADSWVQLTSSPPEMGSFFQFGRLDLSQLDGSVAVARPSRIFHFTRVFEGASSYRGQAATTFFSIANPGTEEIELELTLLAGGNGAAPAGVFPQKVTRTLPAKGFLYQSVSDLFGSGVEVSQGRVEARVTRGGGAVGFELIQLQDQATVIGLNAATQSAATQSFSAQLASQPGVLFTNVNLVNTSEVPRSLTLTAFAEDGTSLAKPAFRALNPGEQLSEDAASLLASQQGTELLGAGTSFVGSLQVEADGPGVIGEVIFGDPAGFQFAAALPLQARSFLEAVFSQVANVPGFFTGLAFFAPEEDADITIEVRAADGTLVGQAQQFLAAGRRLSKLVPELVSESDGQAGGYILVRSTAPLIAQQLFGALGPTGIQLLSAVPPTIIAEPDTGENPVPVLTSLQPATATAGAGSFTLQVSGSDFVEDSEVHWNGEARPANFVSATQLQAAISASDIAAAGSAEVTVFTPAPGGGFSAALSFAIDAPGNPVPVLSTLDPASAQAGGEAFTLRVLGSGFVEDSEVRWNGEAPATTVIGSQELRADIPASDITEAGSSQVTVFNPAPGGGLSEALPFEIRSPTAPTILDVQAEALDEDSAKVTIEAEDPDGDIVKLEFSFFLNNNFLFTREINSPQDVDLSGFTSGTLDFEFTEISVDTGFGRVLPNKVEVVATDAEGLMSDPLGTTF